MLTTVPDVIFKTRVRDESIGGENPFRWQDVSSDEIFKGKSIVIFALPGAYTPTCSNKHLPGFDAKYQELVSHGINEVYCLSVNDAFVMYQWGQHLNIANVKMLPDGNGEFTAAMGMLVKKYNVGFGNRSWRYSMLVEDKNIVKIFSEPGQSDDCPDDPFTVSDVDTLLAYLPQRKFV
ncbi:peroxiredoxin [Methylomonas sp. HW2-6]|uniref:peroxiredoxin n=1 Tax=Methylomonas sp. HW2-6 TaxID=3376687 RepID=UPI004041E958